MPSAWMLGPFVLKSYIVVLIISFLLAVLFFRFTSPHSKNVQKALNNYIESLVLTLVVSIFIAKIILHFPLFTEDPMAVLAHPSDANVFYIAFLFTILFGTWKWRKIELDVGDVLLAFIQIFAVAAFVYELAQLLWENKVNIMYITVLVLMVILSYLFHRKMSSLLSASILLLIWGSTQLILPIFTETSLFQYTVAPAFYSVIFLVGFTLFMLSKGAGVKNIVVLVVLASMFMWAVVEFIGEAEQRIAAKNEKTEEIGSRSIGLDIGDIAPDFSLETLNGEKLSLSEYRGQVVMINFWATWCPPCRAEMPDMQRFYEKSDVVILAVNQTKSETSVGKVQDFTDKLGITYPILLDQEGEIDRLYRIQPLPTTYMIDPNGVIRFKTYGPMNYDMMMKEYRKLIG